MTTIFAIMISVSLILTTICTVIFWGMINAIRKSNNAKTRYYNLLADEMEAKYENYVE